MNRVITGCRDPGAEERKKKASAEAAALEHVEKPKANSKIRWGGYYPPAE